MKVKKSKSKKVVYIITTKEFNGIYKIGIAHDVRKRIKALQTGCPYQLYAVGCYKVRKPATVEKMIHLVLYKKRIRGEWFKLLEVDLVYINTFMQTFIITDS
jgi:predicted GIY-YIG superfamily endonuclease